MSILDTIRGLFDRGPLLNADKPAWAAAQSLPDVGRLTAAWLRGDIRSTPGYYGPVDVDEDIAPGITAALVALNLAGLVTENSQGACADTARYPDTAPWGAWVSGFADDATFWQLDKAIFGTGFYLYAWPPASMSGWSGRLPYGTPPAEGPTCCRQSVRDLRFLYGDCGQGAVDALLDAWQVVIYDLEPGRNTLWPLLASVADDMAVAR